MTVADAVDAQLVQRVLVKLRGEGERWVETLNALEALYKNLPPKNSATKLVKQMQFELLAQRAEIVS
jgi:hypothetical protein